MGTGSSTCGLCARQVSRVSGKILTPVRDKIRNASATLLFLGCLVTLTSAFNLPSTSRDLSSGSDSHPAAVGLTLAERVAYQRAIEEVYWRHRIWPKENPIPKPSLDAVMSHAQLERKVKVYLGKSELAAHQRGSPITASKLQAEMERMASHTKQPKVLREIFEALGNDPFVIAECLARPIVAERLLAEREGGSAAPRTMAAKAEGQEFLIAPRLDLPSRKGLHDPPSMSTEAQRDNVAYKLPEISTDCTEDTWTATSIVNAPDARDGHTAVWTGSEMIVWGGAFLDNGGYHLFNTGGSYNPATDSWTATSTTNAPIARWLHTAVWTGSEMIIWGGGDNTDFLNTGGRYNPTSDSWTATSTTTVPTARAHHTAVWTGSEMIVWGGYNYANGRTYYGGRYNPGTDSWVATSIVNHPEARWAHNAEWTGSEMIVWGGTNDTIYLNTGAKYNPTDDSWTPTSTANAPLGRVGHTAIWSGSEMIVWGGVDSTFNDCNTGGRYNPTTDSWSATSTNNAPSPRDSLAAVWTGSEMIVWGGAFCCPGVDFNTGGRYNAGTDSWTPTSTANAPFPRYSLQDSNFAVWTGSEMIVWGEYNETYNLFFNTGGRYCAQSQAPMAQSAFSRKTHGAVGTFDVPLPLTGNVGVECRIGGATNDYQMIINFATTVTIGSALLTSGTGSVSSFSVSGSQVTVNLTGVTDAQRITVTLMNVNDGTHMGDVPVSMGVLIGDVNGNTTVNASDVSLTKSQVGMAVSSSNFREDVNANGTISATDVALAKSKVGTALPP